MGKVVNDFYNSYCTGSVNMIPQALLVPGTPFNLACGFLFEVWIGGLVALAGFGMYFSGRILASFSLHSFSSLVLILCRQAVV